MLGIAAAIRYSEILFVVPGLIHLALDKRYRDGAVFVVSFVCSLFLVLEVTNGLYWGERLVDLRPCIGLFEVGAVSDGVVGIPSRGFAEFLVSQRSSLSITRGSFRRHVGSGGLLATAIEFQGVRTAMVGGLLIAMVALGLTLLRFRSSEEAVDAARYVAESADGGVVVQRWTSG